MKSFKEKLEKAKEDSKSRKMILYTKNNPYIKSSNLELKESFKPKSKKSVKSFRDWI